MIYTAIPDKRTDLLGPETYASDMAEKKLLYRTKLYQQLGSLSNYDDDHNHDFKKTIGLMIKTTAVHVHHAF